MRSGYIIFLLASLLSCLPVQADEVYVPREARNSLTANADWTFMYFPSGEETPEVASAGYDDSSWPAIALPHTWFTYETTGDIHPFIRSAAEREDAYWWNGWGWYRKHIRFGKELEGKHISVEFDGVQKYAKVYMNGCLVGEHKGGYTSFYFDLTPYINFGEDNILAVQVSSRRDDRFGTIPPATAGNFNVYGGIYRDVRIVVRKASNWLTTRRLPVKKALVGLFAIVWVISLKKCGLKSLYPARICIYRLTLGFNTSLIARCEMLLKSTRLRLAPL